MAVSRPIVFALVAAVLVGAWAFLGDDGKPTAATAPRKRVASAKDEGWDLPAPDPKIHFARLGGMPRNAFVPLVSTDKVPVAVKGPPKEQLVQIPAAFAGGEGGWAYTGLVEANGVRMALLENKGSKQTGYVQVGEPWKKAQIVDIETGFVVMSDEKGTVETVYRFDPNAPVKSKGTPGDVSAPVGGGSPLSGPINPINPGSSGTVVRPFPGGFPIRRFVQENG